MTTDKELAEQLGEAYRVGQPLAIVGAGTKEFYGRDIVGKPFAMGSYRGVVAYEPTELVVSVRSGTLLHELQALLAEQRQMLAFEPPSFGSAATIGGTVACGLGGPRRPYVGAVRDFVLGVVCINGRGQILRFGGQVMKNVAGFDVSRLMAGAMGGLGVLLEVSFKVLPIPAAELSLEREAGAAQAIELFNAWAGQPLPLSAACYLDGRLYIRLSGAESAVKETARLLGGTPMPQGEAFWRALREHELPFFARSAPLWRIVVPAATPPLPLPGQCLVDWGGAQRWLYTDADTAEIRKVVAEVGGHASVFRGGDRTAEVFMPLASPLLALQQRVKAAFDPKRILNPGRLYASL